MGSWFGKLNLLLSCVGYTVSLHVILQSYFYKSHSVFLGGCITANLTNSFFFFLRAVPRVVLLKLLCPQGASQHTHQRPLPRSGCYYNSTKRCSHTNIRFPGQDAITTALSQSGRGSVRHSDSQAQLASKLPTATEVSCANYSLFST